MCYPFLTSSDEETMFRIINKCGINGEIKMEVIS
jgi:hypothetical protein